MRFIIEGLLLGGVLILVDVENWLDNVRMYNGYLKNKQKEKMSLIVRLTLTTSRLNASERVDQP